MTEPSVDSAGWPELPYASWTDTIETLPAGVQPEGLVPEGPKLGETGLPRPSQLIAKKRSRSLRPSSSTVRGSLAQA